MPKPQQVNIHVVTQPGEELEFHVKDNIRGKELFDLVCRAIGVRESNYFGLYYQRAGKPASWLRLDKKIRSELGAEIQTIKLHLKVEFYPEDAEQGLILQITQHLFFLHVKNDILNENIYCPAEEAVLMASFSVQAKYGDYDAEIHKNKFLAKEQLLPKRVTNLYHLTDEQWDERIVAWYAEHCYGLSRSEAEMEYLKIAQDLDMYGIGYYGIQNDNGTNLWLGISAVGINVYEEENKLVPKVSFMWSEIRNISFKNKQIWIEPMEKEANNFNFISTDVVINREILLLCSGNHDLYMKRRRPDSLQVQVMKSQAKELQEERQRERNRFLKENSLRIQATQAKLEAERRLQEYESTLETYRLQLKKAEETTDLLAEKALVAEEEAMLLVQKAQEFETEIRRLRIACSQKDEEKFNLESHIQNADYRLQQIMQESQRRARETMMLKQELDQSRQTEKLVTEKLLRINNIPFVQYVEGMPQQHVNGVVESENSGGFKLLQKERVEYLEKSHHLQRQLTELKTEIEGLKINGSNDILDRIHLENVDKGENKYSTMQKLQAASTNARIEVYQKL